jgi:hypothetical protein
MTYWLDKVRSESQIVTRSRVKIADLTNEGRTSTDHHVRYGIVLSGLRCRTESEIDFVDGWITGWCKIPRRINRMMNETGETGVIQQHMD